MAETPIEHPENEDEVVKPAGLATSQPEEAPSKLTEDGHAGDETTEETPDNSTRKVARRRKQKNKSLRDRGAAKALSRTPIADLPPDRQAEIAGRRLAGAAKRKHVYRPQVPEVVKKIDLHTHEITLQFTRDYAACNEYAVAIDYVARERLTIRSEFNHYLQEFQEVLDELSGIISTQYSHYEERSNGGMTKSRMPHTVDASVQSNRSLQLLDLYKSADDIIRMVQFLNIFGDLPQEEANRTIHEVERALSRCVKGLRNVKLRCFRRIVEIESLRIAVKNETTIEDIEGARRVAAIKNGVVAAEQRKVRKSKKKPAPSIDPGASATEPLVDNVVQAPHEDNGSETEEEGEKDESPPDLRATAAE